MTVSVDYVPVDVGRWSLFVQPDGPNTDMYYLGCDDMGDIEEALGDITQKFCPDPINGGWKQSGQFQGEPSPATFDLTSAILTTASIVSEINCPATFYVVYVPCGKLQIFGNWQNIGIVLPEAIKTNNSLQVLRKRVPADNGESVKVTSWSTQSPVEVYDLVAARQSINETEDINAIIACNVQQCQSSCGITKNTCTDMYVVTDAPAGSPTADADVWVTSDGGANWTEGINDPFGAGEDIASVVCVEIDSNITRVIVARGTTDAANPAEIAYSDDSGVTWTNVNVGSVNGQYAPGPHSLFTAGPANIWLVTSGGYIYYSSDSGESWSSQEEGIITVGDYYCIHGSSENILYAGAAGDVIVRTTDGGVNWSQVTATGGGGDILTVWTLTQQRAWIGTDDGTLWYTNDGGTTWNQRTGWSGSGTGQIRAIEFAPDSDLIGYMAHNDATPDGTLLQTINGGRNWRTITGISNNGFNDIFVCEPNKVFVVGETGDDGTGMIIKYQNVTQ